MLEIRGASKGGKKEKEKKGEVGRKVGDARSEY